MKKYDKILSILIIISGAFALVCYVSYFIKLFVYPEGTLPIIACVTVILGVCLPISLDKYIRKLTKKAYPVSEDRVLRRAVLLHGYLYRDVGVCLFRCFFRTRAGKAAA